jgi:rhodanese-related sulfurtransferase
VKEISPLELKAELAGANPPRLLDVREKHELEIAAIPVDKHIPMGEVAFRVDELDKDADWVIICRSGGRSGKITEFLELEGLRVRNMTGGLLRWSDDVDPSMEKY